MCPTCRQSNLISVANKRVLDWKKHYLLKNVKKKIININRFYLEPDYSKHYLFSRYFNKCKQLDVYLEHYLLSNKVDNIQSIYGIIYKATNKVNGFCYIGQTKHSLTQRMRGHLNNSLKTKDTLTAFRNAINKYGWDNFEWEVIDVAYSLEELNEKEIYCVDKFCSMANDCGYNVAIAGGSCNTLAGKTEDELLAIRKRMSESRKGRKSWNKGLTKETNESVRKISESNKGKKITEEQKEKMRLSRAGYKHSEETKSKIRNKHKGKTFKKESIIKMFETNGIKKVVCFC